MLRPRDTSPATLPCRCPPRHRYGWARSPRARARVLAEVISPNMSSPIQSSMDVLPVAPATSDLIVLALPGFSARCPPGSLLGPGLLARRPGGSVPGVAAASTRCIGSPKRSPSPLSGPTASIPLSGRAGIGFFDFFGYPLVVPLGRGQASLALLCCGQR